MDVSRRDAIKAVATAGAVAAVGATGPAAMADEPLGYPAGWGADGDQVFKLADAKAHASLGGKVHFFSDNCGQIKDDLDKRFKVTAFGSCDHPTPVDADAEAAGSCLPQVIANGGVINTEFGHKTVKHKIGGGISYNTYLAYAAADRP